jgi:regulator of protease activity HflC (stomatin/prohibitin superfamily)
MKTHRFSPIRFFALFTGLILSYLIFQRLATSNSGIGLYIIYGWFLSVITVLALNYRSLLKWIGVLSMMLMFTGCNTIPSDQIGVFVKNFGKTPQDYSIVMGTFPIDLTRSTWSITFPGKPLPVNVDPLKVNSKDGVQFTVDPSTLVQLMRTNEACRKYAFKMSTYRENVDEGLQEMLLKEVLDVTRSTINSANGDSVMFNQTKFVELAQSQLSTVLAQKYGIEVLQFSMSIDPPANLQRAINDRLLAEQETKKTMASLANEEAKVKLELIKAERAKIEQVALTPAMLRKMELEAAIKIYSQLSKSSNRVIVVGDPTKVVVNQ